MTTYDTNDPNDPNDPNTSPDLFTGVDRWAQPRDCQNVQSATPKPTDEPLYPRRSPADRRRDVIKLLIERPEISNRRAAYIAGVSRELVNAIQRDLIRKSQIASCHALYRVGADGKTYSISSRSKAEVTQRKDMIS